MAEENVNEIQERHEEMKKYGLSAGIRTYSHVCRNPLPVFLIVQAYSLICEIFVTCVNRLSLIYRSYVVPEKLYIKLLKYKLLMRFIYGRKSIPLLIKFPLRSWDSVALFYLIECQRLIDLKRYGGLRVLKLDLSNEAKSTPVLGGIAGALKRATEIHAIEIENSVRLAAEEMLKRTGVGNVFCAKGDIRCLPYAAEYFDVIFDLSTIDHVNPADHNKVFFEYQRVLKRWGTLLLVVRFGMEANISNDGLLTEEKAPDHQYYFDKEHFLKKLGTYFHIEQSDIIFSSPEKNSYQLVRFVCRHNSACA